MSKFTLEVCVDSLESAMAAQKAGAKRIELCSNLVIGGTTPSQKLFEQIKSNTNLKINVMIRPRFGDFCYTDYERDVMKEEVIMFKELGANGVVFGLLNPDGSLNTLEMERLILERGKMSVTLNRAFDMCADPMKTMEEAIELKVDNILTSGQSNSCLKGAKLLYELHKNAKGRIHIMVGAGVTADVIKKIYLRTGITSFHMSGQQIIDSQMTYRKEGVHMGLNGFSEYEIYRTDEEQIKEAIKAMRAFKEVQ